MCQVQYATLVENKKTMHAITGPKLHSSCPHFETNLMDCDVPKPEVQKTITPRTESCHFIGDGIYGCSHVPVVYISCECFGTYNLVICLIRAG